MSELRWILLGLGTLAIGAIWGQRSKQRKAEHIAREQQHGPTTLRQYAKDHDGGLFS